MEIRTLRYFLAVARAENMTKAAQLLHVTQPTLSRALKSLEDELGKKLFIRHSFRIELTEEGVLLRDRAEDLVSMADKIEREFYSLDELTGGELYFGLAESRQIRRLAEEIEGLVREGYTHFLSGGAMGTDIWAAEAVLLLRYRHPEILLEMVSPFDSQAARWSERQRARHDRLFALADIVTATGHAFSPGCLQRRNRYLVDNADLLLAATLGVRGGTEQTVAYARRAGVPVRYLAVEEPEGETAEKEEKTGAS